MKIEIVAKPTATTRIYLVNMTDAQHRKFEDFDGSEGSSYINREDGKTDIMVGIGKGETFPDEVYRSAVRIGLGVAVALKRTKVALLVPPSKSFVIGEVVTSALYRFDKYKSEKKPTIELVELHGNTAEFDIEHGEIIGKAVNYARDLQNDNAGVVTPEYLLSEAIKIFEDNDQFELEYLDENDLHRKGLNLLYAVGQGSPTPPRLIILKYTGDIHDDEYTALVGKGVTFDSGGLSLKPSDSMLDMRMDMSGASAVLGTMKYIAERRPEQNIIAVIPTAHNAIGSNAYKLGDVFTAYDGTTVEIRNTDAEGRVCIADSIAYVKKNYNITEIVDIATLTGAIMVALGETIAGIFTNDHDLCERLTEAGEHTGEHVWELPIRDEHRRSMKSDVADLRNISNIGRNCGAITASAFIEHFVGDTPWCHIDIAGTAHNSKKGGTGWGVRLLIEAFLD